MLLPAITLLLCLVSVDALPEFHSDLSEDELNHYFDTPFSHEVPDYEIISPVPIRGSRPKREVPKGHQPLEFNLTALGEAYHLQLQQNTHLIPKSCLAHLYQKDGTKTVKPCALADENCYYHGSSLLHNGSRVAVSTCWGLHGIIATADHELHIQPIREEHKSRVRRDVASPHIVYRKTNVATRCTHKAESSQVSGGKLLRKKRKAGEKTIELLVVTDKEMKKFHSEDTKRYTLTVVNIAAQRFLESSLDEPIHLAVVKLIILSDDKPKLDITQDAKKTLGSFCTWQEAFSPKEDSDPQHADASVLITRLDIQIEGEYDDTGLSNLYGMCKPSQRCSYNQDTGLDLGLTIAHELGHGMGIGHDGDGNSCEKGKNIMSSNGGTGSQAFQWSSCSLKKINEFRKSKQSKCLDDNPSIQLMKVQSDMPGLIYDANAQCRLSYGEGSSICEGTTIIKDGNECARLVCFDPLTPGYCTFGTAPRMDGTICGEDKWCIGGKCESYSSDGPKPVDGGWSAWDAEWTACSRTCGGGVKLQRRRCDNPRPLFGGKCVGSNMRAELCNMNKCKTSGYQFKEEQCAATNSEPLFGQMYSWVPYERQTGATQCQMQCKAVGEGMIDMRRDQYQDGTECDWEGTSAFYRCVTAKCRKFGCDGILDSGATFDECGKCDGKGDTCRKVSGTYKKGRKETFVTFVTIPKEATGVTITNENRFTLMSVKVQGKILFNVGGKRNLSGTYSEDGVIVEYRRTGPERIKISGPLPFDVEAQVWRQYDDTEHGGVAPDVYFEYHVPSDDARTAQFIWKTMAGKCNRTCGVGSRAHVISCVRADDVTDVNRRFCDIRQKPNEYRQPCNTQACPARWKTRKFGKCSRSCGRGTMKRMVQCVQLNKNKDEVISDNHCSRLQKPNHSSKCNTEKCKPKAAPRVDTEGERCVDKEDCSLYEADLCTKFTDFSKLQCRKTCNWCDTSASSTTSVTGDSGCVDLVDCPSYGDDVCSKFGEWSTLNCKKHCGLCPDVKRGNTNSADITSPPTTTDDNICVDKKDCSVYGAGLCTGYADFSKLNCRKTCNLCPGLNATTPGSVVGNCADLKDCLTYGADVCAAYEEWSKINCKAHCGLCTVGGGKTNSTANTGAVHCVDTEDCSVYGDTLCTEYAEFSKLNCRKTCHLCGSVGSTVPAVVEVSTTVSTATTCADRDSDCATAYDNDICTKYAAWAHIHCQKYCGICKEETDKDDSSSTDCKDLVDCLSYGDDVCTAYGKWSTLNCKKHCGLCSDGKVNAKHADGLTSKRSSESDCKDLVNCTDYGKDTCTSYAEWAQTNCKSYCGFCSMTRKRRYVEPREYPLQHVAEAVFPVPEARFVTPAHPIRIAKRLHVAPNEATESTIGLETSELWRCNDLMTTSSGQINTIDKLLDGATCDQAISVPLGTFIVFHFSQIVVDCSKGDRLMIVENDSNEAVPLCHPTTYFTYKTSGNNALLKMKVAVKGHGYNMTYNSIASGREFPACSRQLNGESGVFTSPLYPVLYPVLYPHNQHCETYINVRPNLQIQVLFKDIKLSQADECRSDYIKIIDLEGGEEDVYCGNKGGLIWESTGSKVKVIFHSDGSHTNQGFKASYTALNL